MIRSPDRFDIALLGGGDLCREVLEKTLVHLEQTGLGGRIVAVADPDPESPGMLVARRFGLITETDFHQLYHPRHGIKAIVLLTAEEAVLEDVLKTKPDSIRLLGYDMFMLFWSALNAEQQKFRKRNEEIETILNSIQDFILVINTEMEIVEVNHAFLQQMGYSREEVTGKKCHEVFQKINRRCNRETILCPLNEVIRTRRPSQQVLTRLDHQGNRRYMEVTLFPVWEKNGSLSKFIEISRDITERKNHEEENTRRLETMVEERTQELKKTHDKLLHQDKMASLGKLSASVVHEINNPISGILNLTLLIKRMLEENAVGPAETEKFKKYLSLMETETRRISRIVSNLLAFSRQSKMEVTQFDLHRLIEKTLFLNANLLKLHSVRVEKEFDDGLPDFAGSEDQLQQVIMNLISNAVEAMEGDGGRRVLHIRTQYLREEDRVILSFRDTGVGISPENLQKLFEPFFTTKTKGKGVGLGLSVAYGIVQMHGGAVQVQSNPGEGSTFTVELPCKPTP
ncbi:MAG: PAS domain-containing protein [Deltaproteobacteria bacterium]|nr:PAS domain-containing protein [Deltaproteobacteria bacterium]